MKPRSDFIGIDPAAARFIEGAETLPLFCCSSSGTLSFIRHPGRAEGAIRDRLLEYAEDDPGSPRRFAALRPG